MLITAAGSHSFIDPTLKKRDGLTNLQVGSAHYKRCLIEIAKARHSVHLAAVGNPKRRNVQANGSLHENPNRWRINVSSSSADSQTSDAEINPKVSSTLFALRARHFEEAIEKGIFNCRFLTVMAVVGALTGSLLCFLKGGVYVFEACKECWSSLLNPHTTGKVVLLLVESLDVFLMGTVMLIFGMGLYGLFINTLDVPRKKSTEQDLTIVSGSNFFGLFNLEERPKWLDIQSLEELKGKLGHVIVMILLVGMFEKSKKVPIHSPLDMLCLSTSIILSSGCLYLLSKLHSAH